MSAIIKLKFFLEKHGFHVSSRLADTLGMRASSVRLFFIYLSLCILFSINLFACNIMLHLPIIFVNGLFLLICFNIN